MNAQHTPGPWNTEGPKDWNTSGRTIIVLNPERFPTAFVPAWDAPKPGEEYAAEEARANARLVAAAPDLLEALRHLVMSNKPEFIKAGIEAIAKAEGRAHA